MRAARRPPTRSVARDIDEQNPVGEVYMRSLVRTQLRLAVGVLGAFALSLCGLPLLFSLAPALRQHQLLGIPVPWLLLGVLVYPFLGAAAWTYVRAAERAERDFADLVRRR
jgi:O-antigen/teichoic acid export membrane protein